MALSVEIFLVPGLAAGIIPRISLPCRKRPQRLSMAVARATIGLPVVILPVRYPGMGHSPERTSSSWKAQGRTSQLCQSQGYSENGSVDLCFPSLSPEEIEAESEELRKRLHKWLDDEFCPEPPNVEISKRCANVFRSEMLRGETEVGAVLMAMVYDLEKFDFRQSFHGAFSASNAAIAILMDRLLPDMDGGVSCSI
eukprot:jgi/Mesvir1/25948/Mv20940-RA.1